MAGGSGTRFWPLSRNTRPKQFLPLGTSGKSLIAESIERLIPLVGDSGSLVVTAASQRDLVSDAVPSSSILSEPFQKNTAACLSFAAHLIFNTLGDVVMLCTPADHIVKGDDELRAVFRKAITLAKAEDVLVTIGIKPVAPEIGYGYIKRGQTYRTSSGLSTGAFSVQQFVEKPDHATAASYVESGDFYWNSGMFVWRPSVLLSKVEALLPETYKITEECSILVRENPLNINRLEELYAQLDSVSIDFGVMEEAENVVVFPGHNFEWSDVGSWSSWFDTAIKDSRDGFQNVTRGNVVLVGSRGCAILSADEMSESRNIKGSFRPELADFSGSSALLESSSKINITEKKVIAAVGLEDIIVVDTEDCLLVCHKDDAQRVREVVEILKERKLNNFV